MKIPAVPGTTQKAIFNTSFAKRSAGMRAIAIESIEPPTNAKQGDLTVPDLKLAAGSIRNLGD